jgi:hypothetical protein
MFKGSGHKQGATARCERIELNGFEGMNLQQAMGVGSLVCRASEAPLHHPVPCLTTYHAWQCCMLAGMCSGKAVALVFSRR